MMRRALLAAALFMLAAFDALGVPDPDNEQRCKDITAMGGANACVASEPLITSGTVSGTFWNPPGSTGAKQCVTRDGDGHAPLWTGGLTYSMAVTTGQFSAPNGISHGLKNTGVGGTDFTCTLGQNQVTVPTNVGRVCIRGMSRVSSNYTGNGGGCQSVKSEEFDPADNHFGNQFQGTHGNGAPPSGTPSNASKALFWSVGQDVCSGNCNFTNTLTDAEVKANWCATEMCWYGNFATGWITPIARSYCVSPTSPGVVVVDRVNTLVSGTAVIPTPTVPVEFIADRIFNWYRATNGTGSWTCLGEKMGQYAMEAYFATASTGGNPSAGPWIGPPVEYLTGGGTLTSITIDLVTSVPASGTVAAPANDVDFNVYFTAVGTCTEPATVMLDLDNDGQYDDASASGTTSPVILTDVADFATAGSKPIGVQIECDGITDTDASTYVVNPSSMVLYAPVLQ